MDTRYEERGYLTENFRLFHLRDRQLGAIDWHYHTFHKIIVFLSGEGSYAIEGQRYELQPGDLIFVGRGCIHRPEISPDAEYERIILYISPEYLRTLGGDCDLETCFTLARERFGYVARPQAGRSEIYRLLRELERAPLDSGFGHALLQQSLFLRLIVELTRAMEQSELKSVSGSGADPRILEILNYLGAHLSESVTADALSERFAVSKYHMMRRFKECTGYTIHSYVTSKRLLLARDLMISGLSAADACYKCGFQDYSAFARAYRKQFGVSPAHR